jgi:hypothetical protein
LRYHYRYGSDIIDAVINKVSGSWMRSSSLSSMKVSGSVSGSWVRPPMPNSMSGSTAGADPLPFLIMRQRVWLGP